MYWSKINHTRCSKENKVLDTLSIVELDTVVLNFKKNSKYLLWERSCNITESFQKIWFRKLHFFPDFLPTVNIGYMEWVGSGGGRILFLTSPYRRKLCWRIRIGLLHCYRLFSPWNKVLWPNFGSRSALANAAGPQHQRTNL